MRWIRVVAVALPGLLLAGFATQHPPGLTPATAHHWWTMHVLLIPVFPLLPLALLVLLRADNGVLAWAARVTGYGFATFYTALDVLAGIAAGLVVENDGRASQNMLRLFEIGDRLGLAGVWMLLACAVLTTVALGLPHGPWVIPGGLVLAGACYVFSYSHIFFPVGAMAMVGLAVGTALLALAAPVPQRGEHGSAAGT
jgi:hypothetical protein